MEKSQAAEQTRVVTWFYQLLLAGRQIALTASKDSSTTVGIKYLAPVTVSGTKEVLNKL